MHQGAELPLYRVFIYTSFTYLAIRRMHNALKEILFEALILLIFTLFSSFTGTQQSSL